MTEREELEMRRLFAEIDREMERGRDRTWFCGFCVGALCAVLMWIAAAWIASGLGEDRPGAFSAWVWGGAQKGGADGDMQSR